MKGGKGIRAASDGFFLAVMTANSPLVLMLLEKREPPERLSDGQGCQTAKDVILGLTVISDPLESLDVATDLLYGGQGERSPIQTYPEVL